MTQKSILWSAPTSGDGAAAYTESEVTRMFKSLVGAVVGSEGVLNGVDNSLAVSGSSSPLSVATGSAFVTGYFYWNDAALNVTVPTPVVGTTGHRVVLRWLASSKTVRAVLISSSDGVAAYPALTQSAGTQWEITLANLTITTGGVITLVDARSFLHFATKVNSGMIDNLAVGAAALANDSVDDTKVGNRVPQMYRRQGNSATDWWSSGTTTQTPGAVRMQVGYISTTDGGSITFPVAYSYIPLVFATVEGGNKTIGVSNISTTGFNVNIYNAASHVASSGLVMWLAIGPE